MYDFAKDRINSFCSLAIISMDEGDNSLEIKIQEIGNHYLTILNETPSTINQKNFIEITHLYEGFCFEVSGLLNKHPESEHKKILQDALLNEDADEQQYTAGIEDEMAIFGLEYERFGNFSLGNFDKSSAIFSLPEEIINIIRNQYVVNSFREEMESILCKLTYYRLQNRCLEANPNT